MRELQLTENMSQGQGLPGLGRSRFKKLVQARMGTLSARTMTGRRRELADLMKSGKVGVLCEQENRWRGNKVRRVRWIRQVVLQ